MQLKRAVQGKLKGIQLYDSWYVGGVPPGLSMLNKTKDNAAPSPSFVGAIRDVQVNGEAINLAGMLIQQMHHRSAGFFCYDLRMFTLIVFAHPYCAHNSCCIGITSTCAKKEIYSHEGMIAVALTLLRFNLLG